MLRADEKTDLEFVVEVEGKKELRYEIARLNLGTITAFVGPVPIVFEVQMPIYLRADGTVSAGITTSVVQEASLSAGLRYEEGAWSPVSDLSNHFSFEPPRLSAGAELKGYVDPPLSLLLYGVAGPFAGITPLSRTQGRSLESMVGALRRPQRNRRREGGSFGPFLASIPRR